MPNTINPTVVGEAIGVSDIYVATITADTDAAYTAGTPEILAPTATIAKETTVNSKSRYYSNKALFTDTSEGETKLTVVIPGLTVKGRATLLGKGYNATNGTMVDDGSANQPYYALGYRVDRPNGVQEFAWLHKGKFSIPKEEAETKSDQINEKTLSLEFTSISTLHQFQLIPTTQDGGKKGGVKAIYADTTDAKFTTAASWFNAVVKPPEITA